MNGKIILKFVIILLFIFSGEKGFSQPLNLFGAGAHYAFLSSFYQIDPASGISTSNATSSFSDGMGFGIFFDSKFSVYSGVKAQISFYPNWEKKDNFLAYNFSQNLLELGILSKIYFKQNYYRGNYYWFGLGPAFQIMSSKDFQYDFRNYVLNIQLALGGTFRLTEKWYLMPELLLGTNIYFDSANFGNVLESFVNSSDILQRGFNLTFKISIGYKKDFIPRNYR